MHSSPLVLLGLTACLAIAPNPGPAADIDLVHYQGSVTTWVADVTPSTGVIRVGLATWVLYASGQPWQNPQTITEEIRTTVFAVSNDFLMEPFLGYDLGLVLGRMGTDPAMMLLQANLQRGLDTEQYVLCRNAIAGLAVSGAVTDSYQQPVMDYAIRLLTRPVARMANHPLDHANAGTMDILLSAMALENSMAGGAFAPDLGPLWTTHEAALVKLFADQQRSAKGADPKALATTFTKAIIKAETSLRAADRQWKRVVDEFRKWRASGFWTTKKITVAILGHNIPLIETQTNPAWSDLRSAGAKVGESVRNAMRTIAMDQAGNRLAALAASQTIARLATQGQAPVSIQEAAQAFLDVLGTSSALAEAVSCMEQSESPLREIRKWGQFREVANVAIAELAKPEIQENQTRQR